MQFLSKESHWRENISYCIGKYLIMNYGTSEWIYILDSCIKSYFYQSIHINIMKSDAMGGSKVIF